MTLSDFGRDKFADMAHAARAGDVDRVVSVLIDMRFEGTPRDADHVIALLNHRPDLRDLIAQRLAA